MEALKTPTVQPKASFRADIPTVGRVVHYVPPELNTQHRAAIVTNVHADFVVDLQVFNPPCDPLHPALHRPEKVPFDPNAKTPRSWHYPERAQEVTPAKAAGVAEAPAVTQATPA